ncbi:MAG: hybrid sensor histidine kinase/response regulator [Candidatus Rokuibacteriota bacterium]
MLLRRVARWVARIRAPLAVKLQAAFALLCALLLATGLAGVFTAVVAAARPRWKDEADAQGRHIEVVTDFDTLPPILANAAEVREVLLNLIFNALDAMPGGGTLSLSTRAERGEIHVAVTDTGVGMPEDVAARIFEPFFTTKGPQASGLGLSVSYGIVRRHGGDLTVDSRPGKGTTFTVSLPIRDVPPPDTGGTGAAPAGTLGLRVLVIDDEDSVRQVLRDLLLRDGHQVWEAPSGEVGIGSLEYQPVDLLCTDLGMPGMTGLEVADRVRVKWPGVKVALVTGWGARVEPADLRAHGIDFLLAKPFRTDDVRRMLAQVGRDSAAGAVGAASVSRP